MILENVEKPEKSGLVYGILKRLTPIVYPGLCRFLFKMGGLILAVLALAGIVRASVEGFDISNYQPNVNFEAAKEGGQEFVIVKVS